MAIAAGQFLFQKTGGTLIDRIQTGGVSSLGIPNNKIYEAGNYETLATIRDTADLSFTLESLDSTIAGEAMMLGPSGIGGNAFADLALCQPLAIRGPFRSSQNHFDTIRGVIVPHLSLESVTYKFGLKANASQTFTLKGDSIYFIPGNPYEDLTLSDGVSATYPLNNTALPYFNSDLGVTQYVVNMTVYYGDGTNARLFNGVNFDYTDSPTSFTFNGDVPPAFSYIFVQYGSAAAESIDQADFSAETDLTIAPAAVRSRDIDVFIGNTDTPPVYSRWSGVQSFECTWKVNLDPNAEFGNALNVSADFVVPDVSGTITTKDVSVAELFNKVNQVTSVGSGQVAGTLSSVPIPIQIRISNPLDGSPLKTLYIPDARFEPPSMQGKVNAKLDTPFKFSSDTGLFYVYPGLLPSVPVITSVSPTSMAQGTTGDVTLTGTGFVSGNFADIDDSSALGIVTNSWTFVSATEYTVNITVPIDAVVGTTDAAEGNPDGGFFDLPNCFSVTSALAVTSISPASLPQNSSNVTITVTGTGFQPGITISFGGVGVVDLQFENVYIDATSFTTGVNVATDAPIATMDVTVTNPDATQVIVPSGFSVTA